MYKNYYLCSKGLIDAMKIKDHSVYIDRFSNLVCFAKINFTEVEEYYNTNKKQIEANAIDFYCQELTESVMSLSDVKLDEIKDVGLFNWIITSTGASTEKNVSAIIGQLCTENKITPIQLAETVQNQSDLDLIKNGSTEHEDILDNIINMVKDAIS